MFSSISRIENLLLGQSAGAGSRASSAGHSSAGSGYGHPRGRRSSVASIGRTSPVGSQHGGSRTSPGGSQTRLGAGLRSPSPGPRTFRKLHSRIGGLYPASLHKEAVRVDTYPLFERYSRMLDRANEMLPDCLVRYINLVNYSRTISLHAKLILSTQGIIQGLHHQEEGFPQHAEESRLSSSERDAKTNQEYQDVCKELEILEQEIVITRNECWERGYNLTEIDMILATKTQAQNSVKEKSGSAIDENFKALRQRLNRLQSQTAWTSKQDWINTWLLQNLAASSEAAALHRTFLPNGGKDLDEMTWARQVLKFWPLDGAAAKVKRRDGKERLSSSIGGVKDGRVGHSARVLLELVDWANSVTTGSEVGDASGNALRGLFDIERPRSPLGEVALSD